MKAFLYRPGALWALSLVTLTLPVVAGTIPLHSPEGSFSIAFSTADEGVPTYRVRWRGREIIAPSGLEMPYTDRVVRKIRPERWQAAYIPWATLMWAGVEE
jgi:hypothetical protein